MPRQRNTSETENDDAMPEEMANEAMAGSAQSDEEWEEVRVGIGRAWDFDKDGPLTGIYVGVTNVELPDDPDRDFAPAHQVGLLDGSGEIVFVWGSYELDQAFTEIGSGDKVRVSFIGRETFSSDSGPRQVKRYRVQKAVRK